MVVLLADEVIKATRSAGPDMVRNNNVCEFRECTGVFPLHSHASTSRTAYCTCVLTHTHTERGREREREKQ